MERLLEGTLGLPENQVRGFQAKDFSSLEDSFLTAGGLSVYLYRVGFNTGQRNLYPRVSPEGRRTRPPLLVDLHYLLTAWGKSAQVQQELLGRAMVALEERSSLSAGLLNGAINAPVFGPEETVDLLPESLSLADLDVVWKIAQTNPQPSASYLARMVVLEPEEEWVEAPEVQTRVFELVKP